MLKVHQRQAWENRIAADEALASQQRAEPVQS
jgi:hypothetical protein